MNEQAAEKAAAGATPNAAKESPSRYIVGSIYDCVFFLYSPLLALVLGIGISHTSLAREPVQLMGKWVYPSSVLIGTFIAAHLILVLARSHGNAAIFKLHPWRFTAVPAALFLAVYSSLWLSIFVGVLAIWWDVYHSSMQTFGLGRIYDMRAGNDPLPGRRLDMWLNILLYMGPILAGVTLTNHLKYFENFEKVGSVFFTSIPARVEGHRRLLFWAVIGLGTPFLLYYVYAYWRLARKGYQVSAQKVFLFASTGFCSIYTWGFNTFGEAFFIMNFFHAWQYFGIVWWSERKNIQRRLRLEGRRLGKPLILLLFVSLPLAYGALVTVVPLEHGVLFCAALVISIMHFWYDGFIWSVRKKQV